MALRKRHWSSSDTKRGRRQPEWWFDLPNRVAAGKDVMRTATEIRNFDRRLLQAERKHLQQQREQLQFSPWHIKHRDPSTTPVVAATVNVSARYLPRPAAGIVLSIGEDHVEKFALLERAPNKASDFGALIEGMVAAYEHDVTKLALFTGSQYVFASLRAGPPYTEADPLLRFVREQTIHMMREFPHGVEVHHVNSDDNARAIAIANSTEAE